MWHTHFLSIYNQDFTVIHFRARLFHLRPLHLSLLTLSVSDLSKCVCFVFPFVYSTQHLLFIIYLSCLVLFLSVSPPINVLFFSRGTALTCCPPRLIEFDLSVLQFIVPSVWGIRNWFYLSHPHCCVLPSLPCRVCLSALVLMDVSFVGLRHILQLANVAGDDLHLIRASRWVHETCWELCGDFFSSC